MRTDTRRSRRGGDGSLCEACGVADTCSFLDALAKPVRECVRFRWAGETRAFSAAAGGTGGRGRAGAGRLQSATGRGNPSRLCPSCRNFSGCQFPRGGGGVWYCGEYA